jgi:heme-degrading monooxygenase HmoA
MNVMILRLWRGRADLSRPDDYPRHFRDNVLPELRAIPGFLGARLTRRVDNGEIEFLVATEWASMDAIRAFAGETLDRAVVEPQAVAALRSFDAGVLHFEVIESTRGGEVPLKT